MKNRCAQKGKKVQIEKYTIRQFALLLLDAKTVKDGHVTDKREEMVTLRMYQSRGYKISATECEDQETQIHYSNIRA